MEAAPPGKSDGSANLSDKELDGQSRGEEVTRSRTRTFSGIKEAPERPMQHLMSESNKKRICCPHWMSISARGWIHRVQRHGRKCCGIWLQEICQRWGQLNAREGV